MMCITSKNIEHPLIGWLTVEWQEFGSGSPSIIYHHCLKTEENERYLRKDSRYTSKGKGKAVPLQAWSGPEGSRKLRFPDFMTTA